MTPNSRIAELGRSHRIYFWTPALRTELRLAYAQPKKQDRGAALDALQRKTGWPRHQFLCEAKRMGLITHPRRLWTREEDRILEASLGELSVHAIAKRLGRTYESVKCRVERLEMSQRVREGFCLNDLTQIFGVPRSRIHEWIEKGLLGQPRTGDCSGIRVADDAVTKFIRENPELISFRLADETFLKAVLYGS
jgi:hypothetical protein